MDASLVPEGRQGLSPRRLVKVFLHGEPFGRKINLSLHNSYDSLSFTLRRLGNNYSRKYLFKYSCMWDMYRFHSLWIFKRKSMYLCHITEMRHLNLALYKHGWNGKISHAMQKNIRNKTLQYLFFASLSICFNSSRLLFLLLVCYLSWVDTLFS
jgi:hypothetical protein